MRKAIGFFLKRVNLYVALTVLGIYPVHAQELAKQVMSDSDFSGPNLLPVLTQWFLCAGASLDNGNTTIKLANANGIQPLAYCCYSINQGTAKPIKITADSYWDGQVITTPSSWYSFRIDVTYTDSSKEQSIFTPFTGQPSWETKSYIFCPKKPIREVDVFVKLYNYTGRNAWFTNITLKEATTIGDFGKFGDTAIFNQTNTEGYLIRQFGANENWYGIADLQTYQNLSLAASSSLNGVFTTHTATITNTSASSRAAILAYRIPITGNNLKWCGEDMRTLSLMDSYDVEYSDEVTGCVNAKSCSKFLWGGVVSNTSGYAIAVDPDYPCQFKIRYSACNQEFFIMFDLGFTGSSDNVQNHATVKFVTWTFTPAYGMRQAIHDFYKLYPAAFRDRIVAQGGEHGTWYYTKDLRINPITNINNFGFKFNQQSTMPAASVAYNNDNGILTLQYAAPWELMIYGFDLLGWSSPAYAAVVQKITTLYNSSDPTSIAIVNSASKCPGTYNYRYTTTAEWTQNYIRFQCNPAPGVHGTHPLSERNAYYDQWVYYQAELNAGWYGIMCDNLDDSCLSICNDHTPIDYDPSHFDQMTTPLVHDINGALGISLEMMIWEYFNGVRQDMNTIMGGNRVILANGIPLPFAGCKLDVLGGEQLWDPNNTWTPPSEAQMLEYRMKAGRKPLVFLQNPSEDSIGTGSNWMTDARTQKYFAQCCAFGIMPSFGMTKSGNSTGMVYFDNSAFYETANPNTTPANMTDRNLFQKYIPVIRNLSQTGWDPVRLATVNDSEVFIERFGAEYITIFNPSANSKNITVNYLPAAITITGKELISGNSVTWTNGQAALTIGSKCVAVLEIPSLINFRFDEGTGTSVYAAAPYATSFTGTTSNTAWTGGVDGQSNNALNFTTSYVNIPSNNLFAVSDDGVTFSAWVKPNSITQNNYNMVISHGGSYYLSLYSGYVFLSVSTGGVQHCCNSTNTLTANNTWSHIAGSYDREGNMKVYVNGELQATSGPFLNPDITTNSITIGKYDGSNLYYFNGAIDDVQICRRGCTDKEIRKLKDRAIIAYSFPLNEGAGTTVYDNFDSSRQATVTGATWHGNPAFDNKDNALYFDGVNDSVTITGSTAFRTDGSDGFTFAARIKANTLTGTDPIISKGNNALYLTNGKLYFRVYVNGVTQWCISATPLQTGTWYHAAAVYEADGTMRLYLNGVRDCYAGPYANPTNEATAPVQIGYWGGNYFNGIIANARIYKRGLAAKEIKLLNDNNE